MKSIYLLLFCIMSFGGFAQKLHKSKVATLNAVTEKGYTYAQARDNPNVFWYKRYDSYGESMVQLTFERDVLRKAVIVHLDPKQTLTRLRDLFAASTREEALNFEIGSSGSGTGIASNTIYYSGKARYEFNNNYNTGDYLFTIILVD